MNVYFHTDVADGLNALTVIHMTKQSNHIAIAQLVSPPKPLN